MASDRVNIEEGSLSADLIAQQGFSTVRRGFDPDEVRGFLAKLAAEILALGDRQGELESDLRDAEYRAAHPTIDEDTILGAVGEETAHILRSAHEASADIKSRAEENASRILKEAHQKADALRAEAETVLSRRTDEAEAVAVRIAENAKVEADRLADLARQQAKAIRSHSEAERQAMIDGAQATREKILTHLARKRKVAVVQVEQLLAGRERLLESYQVVRDTLDQVTGELARAETAARAAADAVRLRPMAIDEPDTAENPVVGGESHGIASIAGRLSTGDTDVRPPARAPTPVNEPAPVAAVRPAVAPVPPTPSLAGQDRPSRAPAEPTPAGGQPAPVAQAVSEPAAPAAQARPEAGLAPVVQSRPEAGPGPAGATGYAAAPVPAVPDGQDRPADRGPAPGGVAGVSAGPESPAAASSSPGYAGGGTETIRPAAEGGSSGAAPVPADQISAGVPADVAHDDAAGNGSAPRNAVAGANGAVDSLFARIRQDREKAVAHARVVLAEPEPAVEPEQVPERPVPDDDEQLLQQRDQAMLPIEQSLTRRLKRVLQDDQNDLLDRLRGLRTQPTAAFVLPARSAQTMRFASISLPMLGEAAAAGADLVDAGLGRSSVGHESSGSLDDLAADLANSIVVPLRRRLEEVFSAAAADDDRVALAESIGGAYREWKTQRLEVTAADHIAAAFARGAFAATPPGTASRWLVEDVDGPCPDCDDNVLAGDVTKGQPYPTGQQHPPAHAGCRCLLVPQR